MTDRKKRSSDGRGRTTLELKELEGIVQDLKNSLEWNEMSLAQKVKVLLRERLAFGKNPREVIEEIIKKIEGGDTEGAIAQLQEILDQLSS